MNKFVLIDMDGTITYKDTLIGFTKFLVINKFRLRFLSGFILFLMLKLRLIENKTLKRYYAKYLLRGIGVDRINKYVIQYINSTSFRDNVNNDVVDWIMKNEFDKKVVLSANFDFLVKHIAEYLSMKYYKSTSLEVQDGAYTGNITGLIPYGEKKIRCAKELLRFSGDKKIVAIGDSISDLELLCWSDNGFLVKTKKRKTHFIQVK